MRLIKHSILPIIMLSLITVQCKKDEAITAPPVQEEEELITTLQLTFTDSTGVLPAETFTFKDEDGPGGNAPSVFDSIFLQENTTYLVAISLLNESVTPVEDITTEIQAEDDEHFFCFNSTIPVNCEITRTDSDGTYEVGLASKWKTLAAAIGSIEVKLKHQPGIKDGTCVPGETDIEIDFPLIIQ